VPSFGGVCAFREVNIEITKSSAYISKEIATYMVNKKLTTMNAVGNKESGFVYEVEWWDKKFKRTLECASKEYTDAMRTQTFELAKQIDKAKGSYLMGLMSSSSSYLCLERMANEVQEM
jgi:phage terminase large subunit-like protein